MLTNSEILQIAMQQSAWDLGCEPQDFQKQAPVVVPLKLGPFARRYYREPIACNLVSYGNSVVAAVQEPYRALLEEYVERFLFYHCFEPPNLHWLEERMNRFGQKSCFMAEYFLPDSNRLKALPCCFPMKVMEQQELAKLEQTQWSNALSADSRELDVLGVGAYDGKNLIALAACSADCDGMWQIGVDVLPDYRRKGIASALTSRLALEILQRGKVPFYCCAWSNLPSVKNALKSGFVPAWVELTIKPAEFVDKMNQKQGARS